MAGVVWEYDARFWLAFYRWSIMTETMRAIELMSTAMRDFTTMLGLEFLPVVRKVTWEMQDFAYAIGQADHPARRPWHIRFARWFRAQFP